MNVIKTISTVFNTTSLAAVFSVFLVGCGSGFFGGVANPPIVTLDQVSLPQGKLLGEIGTASIAFKGIPYAAAPTGENRWRSPQPAPSWVGVRDATQYGSDCAQPPSPHGAALLQTAPAEDCLFLNVWKPLSTNVGDKLPVIVWVHGGGFVYGGTSKAILSGENFARDGVVFVSMNYRLGRYGFFAHPALAAELGENAPGTNFGILDQVAALEWVRDNIAAFGGDSNNVTVFGESAGGTSVLVLLQTPLAKGLFHKAIAQSAGGRTSTMPMTLPHAVDAASVGEEFAPGLSVDELRALPEARVTGSHSGSVRNMSGYSGPLLDGTTILSDLLEGAEQGRYMKVPLIIGATSADGFPFMTDKRKIFKSFGVHETKARSLYDPDDTKSGRLVAVASTADSAMIEPARAIARVLAPSQPVYLYRFAYALPQWQQSMGGMPHAAEIPYVFDTLAYRQKPLMIPEDVAVAELAHQYWVNFAKRGKPDSTAGVPVWPMVAAESTTTVQIIDANGARHAEDPFQARLDLAEQRATKK